MPEIVITATRTSEEVSRVPANVTVVNHEEIERSPAGNVAELLRIQQGVQVTDISGTHRSYWVDLRGFGDTASQNTLVLIDGRRVTQADISGTDWGQIPLDRIERIEIVRGGSGGVFYGDNASGGVINIITKKGKDRKFGLDLSGGSYETFRAGAYAEGNEKKLSYNMTGSYLTSNGYRLNGDTNSKDVGATLNYNLTDAIRLHLSGGFHKDNTGLPGALKESDIAAGYSRKDSIYPNDYADTEDGYLQTGFETHFGEGNHFKIDLSTRKRTFTSYANYTGGSFTGDTDLFTTSISPQLLLCKTFTDGYANRLILGADYQHVKEDIRNDSLFFGAHTLSDYELKKTNYGAYLHDELTIMSNLAISGGYRFDRAVFDFSPGTPSEASYNEHSVSAGINYNLPKNAQIYFNLNRSFRYPVLDEMFSFYTSSVSALAPQTSKTWEVGTRCLILPAVKISLNFFRTDTKKEIIYNPNSYNNENLDGRTQREGIETGIDWQALSNLSFFATYTHFAKAKIEDGQFAGKRLPGVAEHKATAGVSVDLAKAWSFDVNGIFTGGRPFSGDFQNTLDNQASYLIANAKVQYRWQIYKLYLDINNLTDKKYSEYGALVTYPINQKGCYPSAGINIQLGLKAEF